MTPFDAAKLTRLMEDVGIDLILASTRHNIRYLTGGYAFHFKERVQRGGSGQYVPFVGIPRERMSDAFYVGIDGEGLELEMRPMWITHRRLQGRSGSDTVLGATQFIRECVDSTATIGVEMPFLPADVFITLQRELPELRLVDATDLMHELRAIKSDAEIDILRAITAEVADSIQIGFLSARHGMLTRQIADTIEREMGKRGLDFAWAFTSAGPGYLRAPSATPWHRGQLMHLDCGAEKNDYLADICRMGVLGKPSALGEQLTGECFAIQHAIQGQLKAGMRYGDVTALTDRLLAQSQWRELGRIVIHGIGMVSHEQPMVHIPAQADRRIEQGHVLSVETDFRHPEVGHVKIEDTIVIRQDRLEIFGGPTNELTVVGT
ncbi:MAG: Xaa-Pro peptidase family protein [Herpetosiphon sp.]